MPIAMYHHPLALILSRSTSMTIYTPIQPTYLYIKQHSITGLKYFGKTSGDPYKYNGSGKHWKTHIKKHGKEHVKTLWVSELYHDTSISDYALQFSIKNNIVESKQWANLKPENGLDGGGTPGIKLSAETRANMSKPKPAGHGAKVSAALKGKPKSARHNAKVSAAKKGKKQPLVVCPHCNTTGGASNMKRWHFDNCKLK